MSIKRYSKFVVFLLNIFLLNINSLKLNGAQYIVKKFKSYKIDTVFGYVGGCNLKLFDELYDSDIRIISNRNEQCCGHSAQAYSKISKKIGVLITTSGPGLTNVITPLQDAYSDGTPLFVISGQVHSNKLGTSAFQECNSTALTNSCVKKNILVKDIRTLVNSFDDIYETALKSRSGPVHLDICKNVFNQEIEINENEFNKNDCFDYYNINKNITLKSEQYKIVREINSLIHKSQNPVIIVGQGCKSSYFLLRNLVDKLNIQVCSTLHGLGIIDGNNKNFMGMLGMHGSLQSNMAVTNADLIIGIGNRFDDRTIGTNESFGLNAKKAYGIVHIDNSQEKIDEVKEIINPNISLKINSKDFINMLHLLNINTKKDFKYNKIKYTHFSADRHNMIHRKDLTIPLIISTLSASLYYNNKFPIISTGVGVHQMQVAQYFKFKYPNKLLTSGSHGTMGVGLPFAIGAQIANPNDLVICIDGDGSFQMTNSDLMTIVDLNLPIKIIIMDNQELQMVSYWQKQFYNSRFSSSKLKNPDFVKLAESYGIKALYCDSIKTLDNIINFILSYKGPLLIHMKIKKVDCLPFVAPNKPLNDMILD